MKRSKLSALALATLLFTQNCFAASTPCWYNAPDNATVGQDYVYYLFPVNSIPTIGPNVTTIYDDPTIYWEYVGSLNGGALEELQPAHVQVVSKVLKGVGPSLRIEVHLQFMDPGDYDFVYGLELWHTPIGMGDLPLIMCTTEQLVHVDPAAVPTPTPTPDATPTPAATPTPPGSTVRVTSVSPNSGSILGGTLITINGANFQAGATVKIGGRDATAVTFVSDTQLTAVTPPGTLGPRSVAVYNPDGWGGSMGNAFSYQPVPCPPELATTYTGSEVTTVDPDGNFVVMRSNPVDCSWDIISVMKPFDSAGTRIKNVDLSNNMGKPVGTGTVYYGGYSQASGYAQ